MVSAASLASSPGVLRSLQSQPFDFDIEQVDDDLSWLTVSPASAVEALASDSAGGCFLCYGTDNTGFRFLYSSSEGFTSQLAVTFDALLATIVTLPNWTDFTHRNIQTMRERHVAAAETLNQHYPHWKRVRDHLVSELQLVIPQDPVATLHESILDGEVLTIQTNGNRSPSVFW